MGFSHAADADVDKPIPAAAIPVFLIKVLLFMARHYIILGDDREGFFKQPALLNCIVLKAQRHLHRSRL
jgi:hypothetical protein